MRMMDTMQLFGLRPLAARSGSVPGALFQWPNGQGTAKFFGGRAAARNWKQQYGSMYSIWSGFKREIVITKPSQVKAFYKDSHIHLKSSDNNAGWLFAELLGQCVGVVSQNRWKRVRRHFDGHFTRPESVARIGTFISDAKNFIFGMNPSGKSITIDPAVDLKYCPFFMVAGIFFGPLTPQQRDRLHDIGPAREELFKEAFQGGINRFVITKYLPGSALSRLRRFQNEWEVFVRDASRRALTQGSGAIIPLWKAVEEEKLSMPELLQTLDESLFANLDVTTHAVSWNILRLAQHKEIQENVRAEIKRYAADSAEYLCKEDTLLAACVVEASRLHPVLPFSNPEAAEEDKVIDGYIVPRKTNVITDAYAINVDNPYWKDAQKYDPHRHLDQKDPARRYNMWRFGFGPRQCLGRHVADIILRVIIAEVLQNYQLQLVGHKEADTIGLQIDSWIGLPSSKVLLVPRYNQSVNA
jgi:cytochrome P450